MVFPVMVRLHGCQLYSVKNQEGVPVLLIQVIHEVPQNGCFQTKQAHRDSPTPILLSVFLDIIQPRYDQNRLQWIGPEVVSEDYGRFLTELYVFLNRGNVNPHAQEENKLYAS